MSLHPPANPQPDWTTIRTKAKSFPPAAFDFVRDGLAHSVEKLSDGRSAVVAEAEDVIARAPKGAIASRHITGQQLCAGLREMARERYGMLALTVLHRWGIRTTEDFGVMVYALIDRGEMRSSHDDRYEDFVGCYEFTEAFSEATRV